jgi:hypothetical protein
VSIADIPLSLRFVDLEAAKTVATFFEGFRTDAAPQGVLAVDLREPLGSSEPNGQVALPRGRIDQHRFETSWDYYEGEFDLEHGTGRCWVAGLFGLQKFLWSLMTVLIPERDGLILHASSVGDARRAYVFPAPSGTGKSTLVRNSPGKIVLSDEGTLVRFMDGQLYAYSSPFRSDIYRNFQSHRMPVEAFYFLRQAPLDRLEPIGKAEALQRMLREVFLVCSDPGRRVASFRLADRMVTLTDSYVLDLTKGCSFWRCVHGAVQTKART